MITLKATNRLSAKAKATIQNAIEQHDKYKKSYFWTPGGSASQRRNNEKRFLTIHPSFIIETKLGTIEVSTTYSESCKNCYYGMCVTLDDVSKDVRLLKKLLK